LVLGGLVVALTEQQQDILDARELLVLRRRNLSHSPNAEREKEVREAEEYLDMLLDALPCSHPVRS
jgi:hypothetical protein